MDAQVEPVGKKELFVRYFKSKTDPHYEKKIALGKVFEEFMSKGLDEIKITAIQESTFTGPSRKFLIDGQYHLLLDLIPFNIVTAGTEANDFTKDINGENYAKTHIYCLTEPNRHLVMAYCPHCESKRMGFPKLRYCGPCSAPLQKYLMSLDVIITAREVLTVSPDGNLGDGPLKIEITISWKHWGEEVRNYNARLDAHNNKHTSRAQQKW